MKWINFISLIFSIYSFAGDKIGNGGQGIVCSGSLQLIDYWYGQNFKSQNSLDLQTNSQSDLDRLNWIINRWQRLDPKRAEQYSLKAKALLNGDSITFITGQELIQTPDTDIEQIPENCQIRQIALQLKDVMSPFEIFIQKDYFYRLSSVDRIGLIIHELLFFEMQSETAAPVREMGLLLIDSGLDSMSEAYYRSLLSRWGLQVLK